jgi:lipoprotein-anchoring transpeptidase ErfK/SrfK
MGRSPNTCAPTLRAIWRPSALVALTALVAACGGDPEPPAAPLAAAAAQQPFKPGPEPTAAAAERPRHLTAAIAERVKLRARPRGPVLHRIGQTTEFGSGTVFGVLARRDGWLKVVASQLPNDQRGWIRARDASLGGTDLDIRVDRSKRQATLRDDGRPVFRFPVAVGRPGNETPLGRFAVTDKLTTEGAGSTYGCCAIALTGHQTRLEPGWPGGDRLAIHGTQSPETIGTAASLGCMRAGGTALRRLMRRVPLGAPVVVKA